MRVGRRRGGCGTLLARLLLLLIGLPILFSLAGQFLFGSSQDGTAPVPRPTSTQTPLELDPTRSRPTPVTPRPSLTSPSATLTAPATSYPNLVLTGQECRRTGTGSYAAVAAGNDSTTCAFALSTQDAYWKAGARAGQNVRITAWSQARGRNITLGCTGEQPVQCVSSTGALVYLYGGTASFR